MKAHLGVLLAGILAGCASEPAAPAAPVRPKTILLIRHAEKPADDTDVHLSPEGKKRADALPDLFKKTDARPDPFPTPEVIFATRPTKHSNRPVETVAPLAKVLKRDVNAAYADDDYPKLAEELSTKPTYAGKTVLVCWHHGNLPELAAALGATDVPQKWKDGAFDRVWVVTFDDAGKARPLVKRHQALLPGDGRD